MWCMGGELLLCPFPAPPPQDSVELSIVTSAFQVGEEGSGGRTAGPREWGTAPRVSAPPHTFSRCRFLFPRYLRRVGLPEGWRGKGVTASWSRASGRAEAGHDLPAAPFKLRKCLKEPLQQVM